MFPGPSETGKFSASWLYSGLADLYEKWLPGEGQQATLREAGYFSVSTELCKTFLLSFENHSQNVPFAAHPKIAPWAGATFQSSIPNQNCTMGWRNISVLHSQNPAEMFLLYSVEEKRQGDPVGFEFDPMVELPFRVGSCWDTLGMTELEKKINSETSRQRCWCAPASASSP